MGASQPQRAWTIAIRARTLLRWAHACGQLAGRLLVHTAKAFTRAGDLHEVAHCSAALAAGNCAPGDCQLRVRELLLDALESIAHFAPGQAGVIAATALVDAGIWSPSIELDPRPHPIEHWLLHGGACVPVHDEPHPDAVLDAVNLGTRVMLAAPARHPGAQAAAA